ncbi:carbohydrate ABC transporter permease [Cohnella sp. 56]|uniref:carbohydrate ABC transporter permease n=1 Tax=Cohnella sp. 56 TaxID=3113722 RepID=UPI0030EA3C2E
MQMKRWIRPWLFIAPALLSITLLKYYPIAQAFFMSLHEYDLVHPPGRFVGFGNYKSLLDIGFFWTSWRNTFVYLVLTLVLAFIPPIIQAVFLNEIKRFGRLFRSIYILPVVIPLSVTVILWKWIWHPDYGLANMITRYVGLGTHSWLNDLHLAKFALIFPGFLGGGIAVFIYLAAIQGIPEEIFEAATLDGAGKWRQLLRITLPNISFVIAIQLIFTVIGVLQILDLPFQMTHGGPVNSTSSVALGIYEYAEKNMDYGAATASSFMLMFVILLITVVQLLLSKEDTN